MYPMQVQPEASIDVWGRPYSDQLEVIRRMRAALPPDMLLAIKANPHPRYELSEELLTFAESEAGVVLLPRRMTMRETWEHVEGAVTVCGTVGLEAVFGRGRCISLKHPLLDRILPGFTAATPEEAVAKLLGNPQSGKGNIESGQLLLRALYAQSWPGLISDPLYSDECIAPRNVARLADGIEHAWRQVTGADGRVGVRTA